MVRCWQRLWGERDQGSGMDGERGRGGIRCGQVVVKGDGGDRKAESERDYAIILFQQMALLSYSL